MTMTTIRRPWLFVLIATVFVVCGAAATVVIVRQNTDTNPPAEDCAIVERLAQDWKVRAAANTATTGSEERDPSSVFHRWSVMSDKARAGADAVSTPALRQDLNKWADGFALFAQLQRDAIQQPFEVGWQPGELADLNEAGDLIYDTANDLRQMCPNGWPFPQP
ncbi:hypothetical protein [Mycobacterium spongiae]|uniref:Uncharacterized protein n=1 Tax=Mycobacterium spongiae TaxID=886343 RepID=A0A975JVC4_9MYCO|nr:hypothetical protein [Mycobacterium spongiae]QUR66005.1 hypothetical protein F6B93_01960 [Mycobacterium spongiae]